MLLYCSGQSVVRDGHGFFQLHFNHLEKQAYDNIYQNMKQDTDRLQDTMLENELNEQYEKLNLSDQQRNVIMQWIDAIHAQELAYSAVVFRMGMQCCFSLLIQLADLESQAKNQRYFKTF